MEHSDGNRLQGHCSQGTPLDVSGAARCMRRGGLVVYPTETFFGLGCRMLDAGAVDRVYQAKRRNVQLPLPVIGASVEQLWSVAIFSEKVHAVIEKFWPGPLTVLLPARVCVPPMVTGETGKIAVRISSHATACQLAQDVGEPLVASSANVSGRPPVTAAAALDPELVQRVDAVLDYGAAPLGGLPSTLVEVTSPGRLRVLRQGIITVEQLQDAGFACFMMRN